MLLPASVEQLLLFISLVAQMGFGITIWARGKRGQVRHAFIGLVAALAIWTVCLFVWTAAPTKTLTLWALRLAFVTPPLGLASFVWLSQVLPRSETEMSFRHLVGLFLPVAVLSLLSVTPWIVVDTAFPRGLFTEYGILLPIYFVVVLAYLIMGFVHLFNHFLQSKGRSRLQIWYVFVGAFLSATLAVTANLVLPFVVHASALSSIGPVAMLFFLGFSTYAIVRFRLMSIYDFLRRAWVATVAAGLGIGLLAIFVGGNLSFLPFFLVALVNGALGTLLLIHNWRSRLHLSFAAVPLALMIWAIAIFFVRHSPDPIEATLYGRLAFLATTLIPVSLLHFAWLFPDLEKPLRPWQYLTLAIPVSIFIPAILAGAVLKEVVPVLQGYRSVYGALYLFFGIYVLGYCSAFLISMIGKYAGLQGLPRLQTKYVLAGILVMLLVGITTNLVLPMMGIFAFTGMGPFASLIFVGAVSYAILRYRLMSIEFVLRRGAMYGVVMMAMLGIYAVSLLFLEKYLAQYPEWGWVYTALLTALLVTVTYQPLLHVLQTLFEQWFYPSRYDYQKTLREVSQEVASVIQLDQLVNLVVRVFGRTIGISETSLLLLHRNAHRFQSVSPELVEETQFYRFIELPESSAVVHWLREKREPLFKDEIRAKLERAELEGNRRRIWELSQVRQELERIGSDNWIPIFFKGELRAILVLGYKLSGDIYTAEDVDLIITLANHLAVALENTQLYQEILSLKDYTENVFHSLANGVLTTDRDGRLVTLNRFAEHLLGIALADVRGKTVDEIWGERHPLISHVHAALRGREQAGVEVGWNRPDQTYVPVLVSSRPLISRRKPIGTLIIMQDRSEVVALEDRIRRADKLAAIGTMAAGMAHEIKNPLASMKVLIQLLPKKIEEKGFQHKLHSILPKEISRIDRIVEGLLSFARTSAPRRATMDINQLLKETLEECKDQAERSRVRIVDQLSEIPHIEADVLQIQQVFSNLIRNGIEAMPEGGILEVQSQLVPSQNGSAPTVRISISDTGPGISADHVVKLFDPFFTTKHSGTGLGLAISHSIIQSHGGSIDVQSEPGIGSHFIIRLPVAVSEEKSE